MQSSNKHSGFLFSLRKRLFLPSKATLLCHLSLFLLTQNIYAESVDFSDNRENNTPPEIEIRMLFDNETDNAEDSDFLRQLRLQQENTLRRTQQAADESQIEVSKRLHQFSTYVDNFFAETEYERENRESRLRVSMAATYQERHSPLYKPRMSLSLPLSNTKNRMRLWLQSNEQEEARGDRGSIDNSLLEESVGSTLTTALGLMLISSEQTNLRIDAGIRASTPVDPYSKLRIRKSLFFDRSEFRFTETFQWRKSEGNSATSQFDIEYPMLQNYFFRSNTQLIYWDIDSYWFASQSFTLFNQRSENSVIAYTIGIAGQDENETHDRKVNIVNYYWVETRYRKRFYSEWLFYQISPGIDFPRTFDYDALPKIEFKLEAVFGNLISDD